MSVCQSQNPKKKKLEFEKKWMSVCQSQNPKKKGIPFQPVHYFSSNKNFTFLHSMKITSLLLVMSVCQSVTKSKKKKNWNLKKNWCPSVSLKIQKKKKGIPFQPVHYFSSNKNFTFLHSMKITSLLLVMSIYLSVTKSKKKNGIPKKCEVNWIELNWIEVNWSEVNWIEVKWSEVKWIEIELNWIELKWIEVKWSELKWSEVKWSELKWGEVKWIELNWIELNWIELNWVELNWIELDWSEVKWSEVKRMKKRRREGGVAYVLGDFVEASHVS